MKKKEECPFKEMELVGVKGKVNPYRFKGITEDGDYLLEEIGYSGKQCAFSKGDVYKKVLPETEVKFGVFEFIIWDSTMIKCLIDAGAIVKKIRDERGGWMLLVKMPLSDIKF